MSWTLTVPLWLKSAKQQGVWLLPGTLQVTPKPANWLLGPLQACGEVMKQVEPQQQAPRQTMVALQGPLATMIPPFCWQMPGGTVTQVPLGVQQAIRVGQVVGEQGVLGFQLPWRWSHSAAVRLAQVPSGRQQAPRQRMVTQVVPTPEKMLGAAH